MAADWPELRRMITGLVEKQEYELVELKIGGSARKAMIQVFIDREGGVTINDCVGLTRRIRSELDQAGDSLAAQDYRLEVSSPGIGRLLTTPDDFKKNVGREIVFKHRSNRDWVKVQGLMITADDSIVRILTGHGECDYPYAEIQSASVKLKWK